MSAKQTENLFAEPSAAAGDAKARRKTSKARSVEWYESPLLPETRRALDAHRTMLVRPEQLPSATVEALARLPREAQSVDWSHVLAERELAARLGITKAEEADEAREAEQNERTRRPGAKRVTSERKADGTRYSR